MMTNPLRTKHITLESEIDIPKPKKKKNVSMKWHQVKMIVWRSKGPRKGWRETVLVEQICVINIMKSNKFLD